MKRIQLIRWTAACMLLVLCISCGSSKKGGKVYGVQDEIEEKISQNKTQGWQIQGTSRTMRGVLTSVIENLRDDPKLVEVTGTANNFSVISTGKQAAAADASNQYARAAAQHVEGRISNDASLVQALGEERDKFYAAYSTHVARLIRGELKEAYTLTRTRQDGKLDCEIHYLVGEPEAAVVREKALEQAKKEIASDMEFGRKIDKYVKEKPENR